MKPAPPVTSALTGSARARAPRGSRRRRDRRAEPAARRRPPPTAARSRSARSSTTWNQTISAGSSSAYCVAPTKPWQASSTQTAVIAFCVCVVRAARAHEEPHADRRQPEERGQRAVLVDRPVERLRAAPVQPRHDVAGALAARVRAGGGGDRAQRERQRARARAARARPRRSAGRSTRGRSPGSNVARHTSATQATSSAIESRKCPITQPGREAVDHGQPAHHGLPEHAERQQQRDPAAGRAGTAAGATRRIAAARHGIATTLVITRLENSIMPCVCSSGVSRVPVAARPVRAAEPGAGQPHGGAGEDDQRADGERRVGDLAIAGRGHLHRRHCVQPTVQLTRTFSSCALPDNRRSVYATGSATFTALLVAGSIVPWIGGPSSPADEIRHASAAP